MWVYADLDVADCFGSLCIVFGYATSGEIELKIDRT